MTERPQPPTILFTGAGGRLGQLLRGTWARLAPAQGLALFAARQGPADLAFSAQDIPATLPHCDMVVALWGVTAGSEAELAQNAALVSATLAVARAARAPRVLHLSSAAVYGPGRELTETDTASPTNAYGHAKLAMEAQVAQRGADDLHQCCLRLANVVGADSLAPALRAPAGTRAHLTRFADGRGPLRSYVSPGALARIFQALAALPPAALPPLLNIATAAPVEMEALLRAAGKSIDWTEPPPGDRQHVTLSTARLQGLLPGLTLPKSAAELIEDWQASQTST